MKEWQQYMFTSLADFKQEKEFKERDDLYLISRCKNLPHVDLLPRACELLRLNGKKTKKNHAVYLSSQTLTALRYYPTDIFLAC